jgi:hypothetical protein
MMAGVDEARFWAVNFGRCVTLIERRGRRGIRPQGTAAAGSNEGIAASLREYTSSKTGLNPPKFSPGVRRRKQVHHVMSRIGLGLIGFGFPRSTCGDVVLIMRAPR